jgi:DNA-binding beta-propeller fold protein YncE
VAVAALGVVVAPHAAVAGSGNTGTNISLTTFATVDVSTLGAPNPQIPTSGAPLGPTTAADDIARELTKPGIAGGTVDMAPASPSIAEGDGNVVEETTLGASVFDHGGHLLQSFSLLAFYQAADPSLSVIAGPKVVFDPANDRFFSSIESDAASPPLANELLLAVSDTNDPRGTWTVYKVDTALKKRYFDEPRLGFSSDKVMLAAENYTTTFCSPPSSCRDDDVYVVETADLMNGVAAHATLFNLTQGLAHPSGVTPSIPLANAETTTAYAAYVETHCCTGHNVAIDVFTGLPSAGTTQYVDIEASMGSINDPPAASQPGFPNSLNTGDDRFQSVSVSDDLGGLGARLWMAGNTKCNVGGTAQACIKIVKATTDSTASTVTNEQEQSFGVANTDVYDPAIVGMTDSTIPNHAFMTYTQSSASQFPSAVMAGVVPNSMTQWRFDTFASGTQAYTHQAVLGVSPWGPYSGLVAEDGDGHTVWAATEFGAVSDSNWATQIAQYTIDGPQITHISPNHGIATTNVVIDGSNFTSDSFVAFGGVPASVVQFDDSNRLEALAPAQPAGTVDITVTTPKGTSPITPVDKYTYPAILWATLTSAHALNGYDTSTAPPTQITSINIDGATGAPGPLTLMDADDALVIDNGKHKIVQVDTTSWFALPAKSIAATNADEIAERPDGQFAYFTQGTNVVPVKTPTGGPVKVQAPIAISGAGHLHGIAFTPDGTRAYVTDTTAGKVWVLAVASGGGLAVIHAIPMDFPTAIAINGSIGYVTIDPGVNAGGQLLTFSTSTDSALDSVAVGQDPQYVAATPAGDYIYVSNHTTGTVTPVHHTGPGSDSALPPLAVGPSPLGEALTPNGSNGFVALNTSSAIATWPSPPPGPITTFPSGGARPDELAILQPPVFVCPQSGYSLTSFAIPSDVPLGEHFTEIDKVDFCVAGGGGTQVTLTTTWTSAPSGCPKPKPGSVPWTLAPNTTNTHFTMLSPPACAGTYKLSVKLYDAITSAQLAGPSTYTIAVS